MKLPKLDASFSALAAARPPRRRAGFTLVELLVVITIIAILASLLLPALAGTVRRSRALKSVGNVRQIGLAMNLYSQDHGQLPRDPREVDAPNWIEALAPYAGSVDGIRTCPADPLREARLRARSSGYVPNYYTSGGRPQSFSGPSGDPLYGLDPDRDIDTFARPADTFLLFEASNAGVIPGDRPMFDDHTHPDTWLFGWGHVTADIDPHRHGKTANYLFADWHVASIGADKLRARIEAGDNFAMIPR